MRYTESERQRNTLLRAAYHLNSKSVGVAICDHLGVGGGGGVIVTFLNCILHNGFTQMVYQPTHDNNYIHLVLVTSP